MNLANPSDADITLICEHLGEHAAERAVECDEPLNYGNWMWGYNL